VCKHAELGGAGHSWAVPVFMLNTQNNDQLPADEDPIPRDGIPHPLPGNQVDQPNEFFEAVQDLEDIDQANADEGWEPLLPNTAAAAAGFNAGVHDEVMG